MMWKQNWREEAWSALDQSWDIVVVGGGITGAGVFQAAANAGLKTLLVEAHDFSFGTSSRSSKLAHGGFRYLYNRQYHVTYESVRQRERLLREAPGLIEPLAFTLPNYAEYRFPSWMLRCGLAIYDLMASKWDHQRRSAEQIRQQFPGLRSSGLLTGFRYKDAVLDDCRLVLRVIQKGMAAGGLALNYARAQELLRDHSGRVHGVVLQDTSGRSNQALEIKARVVVNATGPWADELRVQMGAPARLRKLRGSHLIFSRERLPLNEALTLFHPRDRRAMFALPWEGATLVGTTDIDHSKDLEKHFSEPFSSQAETEYLLEALRFLFPQLQLTHQDILSSFSGLRPIIRSGAGAPSQESRAHQVWDEEGLITITGGKLTTFRLMANQTLSACLAAIGKSEKLQMDPHLISAVWPSSTNGVDPEILYHLGGRYGPQASKLLAEAGQSDLEPVAHLPNIWAEIGWAARREAVEHLDDLLLRRVRLGLLLPEGGRAYMPRVRAAAQQALGWDNARWQVEESAYWKTWGIYYSPNPG